MTPLTFREAIPDDAESTAGAATCIVWSCTRAGGARGSDASW
jgi:hypothetical protein